VESKLAAMQSELERARHFTEKWFTLSSEEKERERKLWNA
jgi:hypothetical protein